MSIAASTLVWERSRQRGATLLVLLALADRMSDNLECWPGVRDIARRARLSERQAQRCLAVLESAGEVAREYRPGTGKDATTVYRLILERVTSVTPVTPMTPVTSTTPTGDAGDVKRVTWVTPKSSGNHQDPSGGGALTSQDKLQKRTPTLEQWLAYAGERHWTKDDAEAAFDHYEANGWRQANGNTIRDWKAAARTCQRRSRQGTAAPTASGTQPLPTFT